MLNPSPQTYDGLAPLIRPIPEQIFVAHPLIFDTIMFPQLRLYLLGTRNYNAQWFAAAAKTVMCKWQGTLEEATSRDESTGELDLSARCKASIARADTWSLGKEVEDVFPEIAQFLTVRED